MPMQISPQQEYSKTEASVSALLPTDEAGRAEKTFVVSEALRAIQGQGKQQATLSNPVRESQIFGNRTPGTLNPGNSMPEGSLENIGQGLAKLRAEAAKAVEEMIPVPEAAKPEKKDLAQLSQESKGQVETKRWEQEIQLAAWKTLLKWFPVEGKNLEQQTRELTEIYMRLLRDIIEYVPEGKQQLYTEKLRQILVCQLDALIKTVVPELKSFFIAYGMEQSIARLERSLYFAVTGNRLSLETVKQDWDAVSRAGRQYFLEGKQTAARRGPFFPAASHEGQGSMYSKAGIATRQGAAGSAETLLEAASRQRQGNGLGFGGQSGQVGQGKLESIYPIKDIQRSERFVKALGGASGNLFATRSFTAKNEALYGVLWTVEKSKTEMFVTQELASSPLRQDVEAAVERMTAAYMRNAQNTARQTCGDKMSAFSQEQAYEIYRYAMKRYNGGETLNKAIRDGFYYALKYFLQSKDGTENSESRPGFFQESVEKDQLKQDLEKGSRTLDEDWKHFLSEMGYDDELLRLTASLYGPWAMLIRPDDEKQEQPSKKGEALAIAGGLAAIAVIIVMGLIFF
ncbi:MAG: hypothetical protein HFE75_10530 [Firmicutes bacterium]|jgi:hypothetical protein|nr:hypothetical protein [Bacillota bacterium]